VPANGAEAMTNTDSNRMRLVFIARTPLVCSCNAKAILKPECVEKNLKRKYFGI